MQAQNTLNAYLRQAIIENSNLPALGNFQGNPMTYGEVARHIARRHILFRAAGIKAGDRIALCAKNSAEWAIDALATLAYGAVAVPILNDFKPESIVNLVNHSQAVLLFTDTHTARALDPDAMPEIRVMADIDTHTLVKSTLEATAAHADMDALMDEEYPGGFTPDKLQFAQVAPEATVLINYTSGSTGNPKGVMLSERALWSNTQFCIDGLHFLVPGDTMLSILPLAHMFGFMVEMIHPFVKGCHVTFLNRTPSPKILLEAFATVQPKLIVAVPLILEKIIRTRVFPMLKKQPMRTLLAIPGLRGVVQKRIRQKLIDVFGGKVLEVIIGGASLSAEVEKFLRDIHFPVTVGYGMTECGPLISYCPSAKQRPGSCGLCVDRMQIRVDSTDPAVRPGVLWVRGDNVMSGYYRNPEDTDKVFEDGWMNTGDICNVDADGYIYIRGRDKNLILGPSGQNIYPEEIEQRLNTLPYVNESLVIDAGGGKLRALVHPDWDAAHKAGLTDGDVERIIVDDIRTLNAGLEAYQRVASHEVRRDEFEKTPKRSIKRFLYQTT